MTVPHVVETGDGEPLILLMGLGAGAEVWRPHVDAWSITRRCVAVDNRGTVPTPAGTAELTTSVMARDVIELIESLRVGPVDIAGISMGSCIAQHIALERPDLVRKLVLSATWAACDAYTASVLSVLSQVRREADTRTFAALLRSLIWTPEWVNAHPEDDELLNEVPEMGVDAFSRQARACIDHDARGLLNKIVAPALVTYGTADIFIRPELTLEVADALPHVSLQAFDGLGHVHHWEALDLYNAMILEWLR